MAKTSDLKGSNKKLNLYGPLFSNSKVTIYNR
jgi:hypothetical protein